VFRQIDLAHPALAESAEDLVTAEKEALVLPGGQPFRLELGEQALVN
jgi:hypothetical protein